MICTHKSQTWTNVDETMFFLYTLEWEGDFYLNVEVRAIVLTWLNNMQLEMRVVCFC